MGQRYRRIEDQKPETGLAIGLPYIPFLASQSRFYGLCPAWLPFCPEKR